MDFSVPLPHRSCPAPAKLCKNRPLPQNPTGGRLHRMDFSVLFLAALLQSWRTFCSLRTKNQLLFNFIHIFIFLWSPVSHVCLPLPDTHHVPPARTCTLQSKLVLHRTLWQRDPRCSHRNAGPYYHPGPNHGGLISPSWLIIPRVWRWRRHWFGGPVSACVLTEISLETANLFHGSLIALLAII